MYSPQGIGTTTWAGVLDWESKWQLFGAEDDAPTNHHCNIIYCVFGASLSWFLVQIRGLFTEYTELYLMRLKEQIDQ